MSANFAELPYRHLFPNTTDAGRNQIFQKIFFLNYLRKTKVGEPVAKQDSDQPRKAGDGSRFAERKGSPSYSQVSKKISFLIDHRARFMPL